METMFDTLLQLPLFQGLAQEDFTCIIEKVKLHFNKYKPGVAFVQKGDACCQLLFLMKGEATCTTFPTGGNYSFSERVPALWLVEPHSMLGMNTTYTSTWQAETEVHTVSIDKNFVLRELFRYDIFRLNYMNIVCNRTQTMQNRLWSHPDNSTEARIAHFILNHAERPAGPKVLRITMDELARILNENRTGISKALNRLQEQQLLELRRSEILIPEAATLTDAILLR